MANLKNVVYLTENQYNTLITQGTITVGGVTYTYDQDNLYLVPKKTEAPANALYETSIYMGTGETEWTVPANIYEARIKIRPYSTSSITQASYPDAEGRWTDLYTSGMGKDAHLYFTWQSNPSVLGLTDYSSVAYPQGTYGTVTVHYIKEDNTIKLYANGPSTYISPAEPLIVDIQYTLS